MKALELTASLWEIQGKWNLFKSRTWKTQGKQHSGFNSNNKTLSKNRNGGIRYRSKETLRPTIKRSVPIWILMK